MTWVLLLALISQPDNEYGSGLVLPHDSREFAHFCLPIIIAEGGHEITGLIECYVKPDYRKKDEFNWDAIKIGGGCLLTTIAFNLPFIIKHYETDREWMLCNSGMAVWATARFLYLILKAPYYERQKRKRMATAERLKLLEHIVNSRLNSPKEIETE